MVFLSQNEIATRSKVEGGGGVVGVNNNTDRGSYWDHIRWGALYE